MFKWFINILSTQKTIYLECTKSKLCWVGNIFINRWKKIINIGRSYVKDNLTKDERRSLTTWRRDFLFNPDSSWSWRSQDEGNRFVVVDKQTDIVKANYQIERSGFVKLNYDPTIEFIFNSGPTVDLICSLLIEVMQRRIKDMSHSQDTIDTLNEHPISTHAKLVSLDIVNMFPSIDNQREIQAVQDILNTHAIKKPSTDWRTQVMFMQ